MAPKMADCGKGAIVNVSSMVGDFGIAGMAVYGSSKAALNLLTKAWAAEFGPKGVRVNAVSPGADSHRRTGRHGRGNAQLASMAPAGHPATPEEIADAIVCIREQRRWRMAPMLSGIFCKKRRRSHGHCVQCHQVDMAMFLRCTKSACKDWRAATAHRGKESNAPIRRS
jgi:NAD(P)-dependent dehydrogenase (short-subunit alcohol dehydrogenase family)